MSVDSVSKVSNNELNIFVEKEIKSCLKTTVSTKKKTVQFNKECAIREFSWESGDQKDGIGPLKEPAIIFVDEKIEHTLPKVHELTLRWFEAHLNKYISKIAGCKNLSELISAAYRNVLDEYKNQSKSLPIIKDLVREILDVAKKNDHPCPYVVSDTAVLSVFDRNPNKEANEFVDKWSSDSLRQVCLSYKQTNWSGLKTFDVQMLGEGESNHLNPYLIEYFKPLDCEEISTKDQIEAKALSKKLNNVKNGFSIKDGVYQTLLKPWFECTLETKEFDNDGLQIFYV